jgi:hypothetical protein
MRPQRCWRQKLSAVGQNNEGVNNANSANFLQ